MTLLLGQWRPWDEFGRKTFLGPTLHLSFSTPAVLLSIDCVP